MYVSSFELVPRLRPLPSREECFKLPKKYIKRMFLKFKFFLNTLKQKLNFPSKTWSLKIIRLIIFVLFDCDHFILTNLESEKFRFFARNIPFLEIDFSQISRQIVVFCIVCLRQH